MLNSFIFLFKIQNLLLPYKSVFIGKINILTQQQLQFFLTVVLILSLKMEPHNLNISDQVKRIVNLHLQDYNLESLSVTHLSGLTNQTFKVSCLGKTPLVFRKFGGLGNSLLDNQIFKNLQEAKIAPKCFYACPDYRIEQYIQNAVHPTLKQLSTETIKKHIFQMMFRYHQNQIQVLKNSPLFIEQILSKKRFDKIEQHRNDSDKQKFQQLFKEIQAQYRCLNELRHQIIEENPEEGSKKIRFCHNDLNNLNIFYEPEIMFIDYQYSAYNYFYYDIANFLNQSTIDYQVKKYPHFKVERHLTFQEISHSAKMYPQYYPGLQRDIIKGLVICNLYWAGWSIIMASDPSQKDFGTVDHGLTRISLYRHYKKML